MQRRATKLRLPGKGSLSGARARQSGLTFEAAIMRVNAWYDVRGEAAIEKVNAPTAGWGASLRMLPSNVDFLGTINQSPLSARGIAFDAKGWTGKPAFGVDHIATTKQNGARERMRFFAQVAYLKGLRDRHGYHAFFLLYCAERETVWLCNDLDTLGAGGSVPIRTLTCVHGGHRVEHHLPHLVALNLLALAAAPRPDGRPHLDYLSLLDR